MFQHILVAVDGSEEAHSGFAFALRLAASTGGRVTAVEALAPAYEVWASVPEPVPGLERLLVEWERAAEERLASLAAGAPAGVVVETRTVQGKPASAPVGCLACR